VRVPFLCGQRCRSENRGRGRTSRRSRQPRQWGHNRGGCRRLSPVSVLLFTESWAGSIPSMINHSGFFTRSASFWGSRSASHFVSSASLISLSVRCRMKTGLPRHLIMTCHTSVHVPALAKGCQRTFLPSGMAARSISTLAWARTSAEADMLTRKSATQNR
jgi:hypothetical protein